MLYKKTTISRIDTLPNNMLMLKYYLSAIIKKRGDDVGFY